MKTIRDIRIFKSSQPNIDGNSLPGDISNKVLHITVHRVAMKLREFGFSLGDFDHLYLNFTLCLPEGTIQPAERSIDRYHPWLRYYDIGISQEQYDCLENSQCSEFVLSRTRQTLLQYFAANAAAEQAVNQAVDAAISQGEQMRMLFKEKKAAKGTARIYLRRLDNGYYLPLLIVSDLTGREILQKDLPQTIDLSSLGEIQLSGKKVTVKPRKNVFAHDLSPICFDLTENASQDS